jgi:hypothetical protein
VMLKAIVASSCARTFPTSLTGPAAYAGLSRSRYY